MVLWIEPGHTTSKASALPSILGLQPHFVCFFFRPDLYTSIFCSDENILYLCFQSLTTDLTQLTLKMWPEQQKKKKKRMFNVA